MGDNIPSEPNKFSTGLADFSLPRNDKTGPYSDTLEIDALVVGAGFAGIFMLKTLRNLGLKTYIFEAGNDIGGTWRWNCYPGAGVDSQVPEYEFSWPEVWKSWNWSTNYPNYEELRAYFDHVDGVIGVRKDCAFNTVVVGAHFDLAAGKWIVSTKDGRITKAKYLILGTGISAKRYIPDWPSINKFKGTIHHSSFWPDEKIDVKGKRCAVVGTGASGVQIVQAWGPEAGELKVFQRTPNLTLPSRKRDLTIEEQEQTKRYYPELFRYRETTYAGCLYDWAEKNTFDDTAEDREAFYEEKWNAGGFRFWLSAYKDNSFNAEANQKCYDFWAKKVRGRVEDLKKRDLLAPLAMPHFFGTKRPCLEYNYYEQFNRPNVDVVDIKNNAIKEFDETGIILEDGTHHEFDVIAVATGFDIVTGAITQLGLESLSQTKLAEEWATGAETYLGLTVNGYPNMFFLYGTHAPTIFSNGPTLIEVQGRWIADCIQKMRLKDIKYINAKHAASVAWKKNIVDLTHQTLIPTVRSTFMGGSNPNKIFEPISYISGIPSYAKDIRKALDDMSGFEVVYN